MLNNYVDTTPVAKEIPYDDSIQTPVTGANTTQEILDYLKNIAIVSASPGFTWGRSGTTNPGAYLLNDSVPSNLSGRTIFLNSAEIKSVYVANQDATAGIVLGVYYHNGDGIGLTLLGTVTTLATRSSTFDVSWTVSLNKQLAVKLENSSAAAKNIVVGILLKGNL